MKKFLIFCCLIPTVLLSETGHRVIRPDGTVEKYDDPLKNIPITCRNHGGIDCAKGADTDGSVFCVDGNSDSEQEFSEECSTARIVILSEEIQGDEKVIAIRNMTGVKAIGVVVYITKLDRTQTKYHGPSEIEPFGVAEYRGRKPTQYETQSFNCENCF